MNAAEYVVPAVLRDAMFVPGQAPGRHGPARVTPGAFRAAGLPVPGHPAQRNVYQLTGRQGLPWSPGIDAHITPGHPDRRHLPGWHLWYRADPARPVHMGPLARCHAVELRARGTCPGSPGYLVKSGPGQLPTLPRWIADLAGPPPRPVTSTGISHGGGSGQARLHGIIGRLLAARRGERNRLLFWASLRVGELVVDGDLEAAAAGQALADAAARIGLVREDGQRAVTATIRSGFERMGVAHESVSLER